jgi:type III secretion protein S
MTPQNILDITREGLLILLWVALPVVAVATVTALLISVLQAVTQIQDQSIGQSLRLIAVMVTVVVTGGWLSRDVMRFAERAFQNIAVMP